MPAQKAQSRCSSSCCRSGPPARAQQHSHTMSLHQRKRDGGKCHDFIYESKSWRELFAPSSDPQLHQTLGYSSSMHCTQITEHEGFVIASFWLAGKSSKGWNEPGTGIQVPREPQRHPTRLQHAQGVLLPTLWVQKPVREKLIFSEALLLRKHTKLKLLVPQDHCCAPAGHQQERGVYSYPWPCSQPFCTYLNSSCMFWWMQPGHHRSPLHSSISRSLSLHWSSAASAKTRHWGEPSANKSKLFWRAKLKKQHQIF